MARIFPFRALRYDTARVNMADVVTQPYDKISTEMQDRYYELSPYNLIRVILGKKFPDDTEEHNVYTRAAETLTEWRKDGILREEAEPALFGYSQTYTVPGTTEVRERRGFIGLGGLHDYADKVVFRHEQTFPKHKSDRLSLFKATRAYCEQIYMLYSDPTFTAENAIFGDSGKGDIKPADLEITDEYGVVHRVWKLTDPTLIGQVVAAMADKPLIIADGHHRYETSTAYMHERAKALGIDETETPRNEATGDDSPLADDFNDVEAETKLTEPGGLPTPAFPEAAMMMTFVNMEAPGITILPTHRVVFGLENFDRTAFLTAAADLFHVTPLTETTAPEFLHKLHEAEGTAFVAVSRDGNLLLTPYPEKVTPILEAANLSPRQAALDVTILHKVILEKLLGLDEEAVRAGNNVRYLREADEAIAQVQDCRADIAFLIKPVTLDQMKDISLNLEVMPQKSTDFYPKLLSGLAMYALD